MAIKLSLFQTKLNNKNVRQMLAYQDFAIRVIHTNYLLALPVSWGNKLNENTVQDLPPNCTISFL